MKDLKKKRKKYIKIIEKEIVECETTSGPKTNVLMLTYKIGDEIGKVNIKDYINEYKNYNHVLKQVKEAITINNKDLIFS